MIRIPLEGCRNFWDIGGYPIDDTKIVRPRMIYRSGRLSGLNSKDLEKFGTLGIRTVIDLRSPDESAEQPDPIEDGNECRIIHIPISTEGLGKKQVVDIFRRASNGEIDTHQNMIDGYRQFPMEMHKGLRKVLDILLDELSYPVLMHCTAGKDRTGFVAAVLLGTAGCDEKTIIADYMNYKRENLDADAKRYASSFAKYGVEVQVESTYPYLLAKEEYIRAMLESISEKWGSISGYLDKHIGFTGDMQRRIRDFLITEA